MTSINLEMSFRGNRDYLHGTSMYTESIKVLNRVLAEPVDGPFKLAIHKIARRSLLLTYDVSEANSLKMPDEIIAELSLWSGGKKIQAWITETDINVSQRAPYLESKIEEKCRIDGKTIQVIEPTGFMPIEELICMTKVLHIEHFPPTDFRWFFSRLELMQLLAPRLAGKMKVTLEQTLGSRITRSKIKSDGSILGQIFFSRVKP